MSLPAATSIDNYAFTGCTSLTTVDLSEATYIGNNAFANTGGMPLEITLGNPAPAVGLGIFNGAGPKNVTVRFPVGATGYGGTSFNNADLTTDNWGNEFRGGGNPFTSSDVNYSISLFYQTY